ncbi:MAG: SpoIID/LytB domain-containing protein [Clostridia bacterium]|nr:SpoIID/LytB domain-containing protein [Clostridia bacterium]
MKKLFLKMFLIIVISFLIPILFTKRVKISETISEKVEDNNSFNYDNNMTIRLLHSQTGEVENLDLDVYLYGVVSAEMPASYELEALKAQAVVARTYTIYKMINGSKHENADICDDPNCCQAWISKENRFARWENEDKDANWQKIVIAVDSTTKNYITYEGKPINALFHSNSGGMTEMPINVWGGYYPYLISVATSGEEGYSTYNSEVILSKDELISKVLVKYPNFKIDFSDSECIKILDFTESGRVKTLKLRKYSNFGNRS